MTSDEFKLLLSKYLKEDEKVSFETGMTIDGVKFSYDCFITVDSHSRLIGLVNRLFLAPYQDPNEKEDTSDILLTNHPDFADSLTFALRIREEGILRYDRIMELGIKGF